MSDVWNAIYSWLLRHNADRLPLLGPLIVCSTQDHKEACREFFIVVIFATMTFWLSAFILMMLASNRLFGYLSLLGSTVQNGELFIFATALLGPILAIASEDPRGARSFPSRTWHMLGLVILGVICSAFYALSRMASVPNANLVLNHDYLFTASWILAACSAGLRYLAILYNRYRLRSDDVTKVRERAFTENFARRHGGEA